MQWIVSGTLLIIWLIGLLVGQGGAIHILFFAAIAIVVPEIAARRRAAMK